MIRSITRYPHLPPLVRPRTAIRFLCRHHQPSSRSPLHYQNNASKYWDSFYQRHRNKVAADWSPTVGETQFPGSNFGSVYFLIIISWNWASAVLQGQALPGEGLGTVLLVRWRRWRCRQGRSRGRVHKWFHESASAFQVPFHGNFVASIDLRFQILSGRWAVALAIPSFLSWLPTRSSIFMPVISHLLRFRLSRYFSLSMLLYLDLRVLFTSHISWNGVFRQVSLSMSRSKGTAFESIENPFFLWINR